MSTRRLNDLKEQIALSGNIRDAAWFTQQYQKGRIKLLDNNNPISSSIFEQFKTAIRVINDIYDNSWDIAFEVKKDFNNKIFLEIKGIYILFSEINITNRDRANHTIKDLLVLIQLYNYNNTALRIHSLKGGRLTLSYAEYQSDYFHSHLSTSKNSISTGMNLPHLSAFCTGSGEINIYHSNINGDGFNEERFIRYAMQIMSLVSYESIEGTPYKYIRSISTRPHSGHYYNADNSRKLRFKNKVISYYKQEDKIPVIDIHIDSTNSYCISDNETFKNFIYSIPFNDEDKNWFFCSLGDNNVYYSYGQTPGYAIPPNIQSTFIFRNVEKRMVIEPAPEGVNIVNYIVHPNLIKYLKEEIEYELNKGKIRKSTIDRYSVKLSDATESIQSNPVPVSADS